MVTEVIDFLNELKEDQDTSKRFKEKTDAVIEILQDDSEMSVEKALLALEELNSLDLSSYLRTQVWDAISLLESTKSS